MLLKTEYKIESEDSPAYLIYPETQISEKNFIPIYSYIGGNGGFYGKISQGEYDMSVSIAGNVIQVRKYEKSQRLYRGSIFGKSKASESENSANVGICDNDGYRDTQEECYGLRDMAHEIRKKSSARRAKAKICSIVNSNFGGIRGGWCGGMTVKFLTMTYAENMQDRDIAYRDWIRFVDGVEYRLKSKIQYLCVPERQERGAYHLHAILHCPYIPFKFCEELWNVSRGQGCFKLEKAKYPENAGAYLAKYVSKEFMETDEPGRGRRKFQHRYWKSEGLKDLSFRVRFDSRMVGITLDEIEEICAKGVKRERIGEYCGEYTGQVMFREFCLKEHAGKYGIIQAIGDISRGGEYDE